MLFRVTKQNWHVYIASEILNILSQPHVNSGYRNLVSSQEKKL
jgi:hypothetical protein